MTAKLDDLTILVVDDNQRTVDTVKMVLGKLRAGTVYTAENGIEAQKFLEIPNVYFDLLICDWNMPEMSGLQVLELVREKYPDILFLMLTGNAHVEYQLEAHFAGAHAFMRKPFSPLELEKRILALLASQGLQAVPAEFRVPA